ncbi:MAG: SEC-C domain-containing protein [Proteobacteria bacterium]|nr:SEC-C domain-containing protein [Pseudomonadota bacterium]
MTRTEEEIFADLERLCSAPGYSHALALFCFRDSYVRYSGEMQASDMDHMFSRSRLIRTEISSLIGSMVKRPVNFQHPGSDTIHRYMTETEALLEELHDSMNAAAWQQMFGDEPGVLRPNRVKSGAAIREPIFYGGESAYGSQYRDLAIKKYSNDDQWLLQHKGFTIGDARSAVAAIAKLQDDKVRSTHRALASQPRKSWTILPGFMFTAAEVAARTGLHDGSVRAILNAFTYVEGSNPGFSALNEYNAINGAPLLHTDRDQYILFQQYSLFEALYESPFYWLNADRAYAPKALSHRGRFTEEFAYERLVHVFDRGAVHANVDVWKSKGEKLGEIDVLVVFGDRAIVLQAKAKRLTLEARKGNDLQIKDDFKKAIQDSYDQAHLCSVALMQGLELTDADGRPVQIGRPKIVYPICIVADHYPALSVQAREFLQLHAAADIAAPLVTDVFAIDAMTEMLESPLRLLSYFDLRARFGPRLMTMQELTLLSFHIKRNLWLNDQFDMVVLEDDIAADLDIAMAVRREGIAGRATPDGILTRIRNTPVGQIISQIEELAEPSTIDLGLLLLQLNEESVDCLSKGITQIMTATRRDGNNHDFTISVGSASSGITVHCNPASAIVAAQALRAHCEGRKYSQRAASWHGLVIDLHGRIRFGVKFEYPWIADARMEALAARLPPSSRRVPAADMKSRPPRNAPCPCGSGQKSKKCCFR